MEYYYLFWENKEQISVMSGEPIGTVVTL